MWTTNYLFFGFFLQEWVNCSSSINSIPQYWQWIFSSVSFFFGGWRSCVRGANAKSSGGEGGLKTYGYGNLSSLSLFLSWFRDSRSISLVRSKFLSGSSIGSKPKASKNSWGSSPWCCQVWKPPNKIKVKIRNSGLGYSIFDCWRKMLVGCS